MRTVLLASLTLWCAVFLPFASSNRFDNTLQTTALGSDLLHSNTEITWAVNSAHFPLHILLYHLRKSIRRTNADVPWRHLGVRFLHVQGEHHHHHYYTIYQNSKVDVVLPQNWNEILNSTSGTVRTLHGSAADWPLIIAQTWFWHQGARFVLMIWLPQLTIGIVGGGIDGVMHALFAARSPIVARIVLVEALSELMAATSAMCFRNHAGLEYANYSDTRSIHWLQTSQFEQRRFFPAAIHQTIFHGQTTFQGSSRGDKERDVCEHLRRSQQIITQQYCSKDPRCSTQNVTMEWSHQEEEPIRCRLTNLTSEAHFSRTALLRHFWDVVHTSSHPVVDVLLSTTVTRVDYKETESSSLSSLQLHLSSAPTNISVDVLIRSVGAFEGLLHSSLRDTTSIESVPKRYIRAMLRVTTLGGRVSACESIGSSFTLIGESGSMLEIVPKSVDQSWNDNTTSTSLPSSTLVLFIPQTGFGYVEGVHRGSAENNFSYEGMEMDQPPLPLTNATDFARAYLGSPALVAAYQTKYMNEMSRRHTCLKEDFKEHIRVELLMAPLYSCNDDQPHQRLPCPVRHVRTRIFATNSAKCTHSILSAQNTQQQIDSMVLLQVT